MPRKLALKFLKHSDLTFFKRYFKDVNKNGVKPSKQKGINLDSKVLINKWYSNLARDKKYYLELIINGPAQTILPQVVTRKIFLNEKNWRLNGEFVHDPDEDDPNPDRYANLIPGDLAVFEFFDGPNGEPYRIKMVLISQNLPYDEPVYQALKGLVSKDDTTILFTEENLINKISNILPDGHTLQTFITDDRDLELLAEGVDIGTNIELVEDVETSLTNADSNNSFPKPTQIVRVRKYRNVDFNKFAKPSLRRVSTEAFERAKVNQVQNGKIGEELIDTYFTNNPELGVFEWSSKLNPTSPYDFKRVDKEDSDLIDVKATSRPFEEPFHISINEIRQAACAPHSYFIYRVYEVQGQPKVRISKNIKQLAQKILTQVQEFQSGIIPDGFTLSPVILGSELNFGPAISLSLPDDEEVDAD